MVFDRNLIVKGQKRKRSKKGMSRGFIDVWLGLSPRRQKDGATSTTINLNLPARRSDEKAVSSVDDGKIVQPRRRRSTLAPVGRHG